MSAKTRNPSVPPTDLQLRAQKLAVQASKLADQAGPATQKFAMQARQGAGNTAVWAKPHVDRARAWMAIQAANGSTSVQEQLAPMLSSMLSSAALKLDPPRPKARRWPKILAGISLLGAGGAAAAAVAMRTQKGPFATWTPAGQRSGSTTPGQQSAVLNPSAEQEGAAAHPAGQRESSAAQYPGGKQGSTGEEFPATAPGTQYPSGQQGSTADQYPSTWSS